MLMTKSVWALVLDSQLIMSASSKLLKIQFPNQNCLQEISYLIENIYLEVSPKGFFFQTIHIAGHWACVSKCVLYWWGDIHSKIVWLGSYGTLCRWLYSYTGCNNSVSQATLCHEPNKCISLIWRQRLWAFCHCHGNISCASDRSIQCEV